MLLTASLGNVQLTSEPGSRRTDTELSALLPRAMGAQRMESERRSTPWSMLSQRCCPLPQHISAHQDTVLCRVRQDRAQENDSTDC